LSEIIDRRSFNVALAYAMLGGAAITITGCGGGGTGPSNNPTPTPTSAASGDEAGIVATNHGHIAIITAAQLQAGGGLTLDIQGDAPHTHSVTLTASEVGSIAGGTTVTVGSSSTDGGGSYGGVHQHAVTFN
jgi:hypothetical protein